MSKKNVFAGQSTKTLFAHLVYEELRKRGFVSNVDILCIYYHRDKSYYDLHTYNSDKAYKQLNKAFPEVIRALEEVERGCVIDNGKTGKGKAFRYIGESNDPLAAERQVLRFSYQPFGQEQIEPNRELRGRILMYGEGLEVVEPLTLREQIREVIKRQMAQYTEE